MSVPDLVVFVISFASMSVPPDCLACFSVMILMRMMMRMMVIHFIFLFCSP